MYYSRRSSYGSDGSGAENACLPKLNNFVASQHKEVSITKLDKQLIVLLP